MAKWIQNDKCSETKVKAEGIIDHIYKNGMKSRVGTKIFC